MFFCFLVSFWGFFFFFLVHGSLCCEWFHEDEGFSGLLNQLNRNMWVSTLKFLEHFKVCALQQAILYAFRSCKAFYFVSLLKRNQFLNIETNRRSFLCVCSVHDLCSLCSQEMFEQVNKAYEFLCSKSKVKDGPDPQNIVLILRAQSILFSRYKSGQHQGSLGVQLVCGTDERPYIVPPLLFTRLHPQQD